MEPEVLCNVSRGMPWIVIGIYTYIYIYICGILCVCVCVSARVLYDCVGVLFVRMYVQPEKSSRVLHFCNVKSVQINLFYN